MNVLYLTSGAEATGNELWIVDIGEPESKYKVLTFNGKVKELKVGMNTGGRIRFAVTGTANANTGAMVSVKKRKFWHSGRTYNSLFVRHWDRYISEDENNAIFVGTLEKRNKGGRYRYIKASLRSISAAYHGLQGLVPLGLESPVGPQGSASDFEISDDGKWAVFVAKDPTINQAMWTTTYVYLVGLGNPNRPPYPINSPAEGSCRLGASSSPFENGYEADRWRIMKYAVPATVEGNETKPVAIQEDWEFSPGALVAVGGSQVMALTEVLGRTRLWQIEEVEEPIPWTGREHGSISAVHTLPDQRLLLTSSSMAHPPFYTILDLIKNETKLILGPESIPKPIGELEHDNVEDFWFEGDNNKQVHSWLVKPSNFKPQEKYPLALIIHGGPQSSWKDYWNIKWNPKISLKTDMWLLRLIPPEALGGSPYIDLMKGYDYAIKNFLFIDASRAIAGGASYGGYMTNWIQGHDFGWKFKALICHDGIFSTPGMYGSEELWFTHHEFNGTLWEAKGSFDKYNPARFADKWATPQLIIHNDLDYRIPVSEGLAAFNVLQVKGIPSRFVTFLDEGHVVQKNTSADPKGVSPTTGSHTPQNGKVRLAVGNDDAW
ncbi:Alpha/Beta hydrolase protein [Tuber indicum]|nr:Alpha/Beta hydrolase protein [Tuber indicum]